MLPFSATVVDSASGSNTRETPPASEAARSGARTAYPLHVGRDPRRLQGLKPDEKVAALLVERATGARARAHDVDGRQGAYDLDLAFSDGRRAALEVTTHAAPGIRRSGVLFGRERDAWPNPGRGTWGIVLATQEDIPRLRAVYGRAITACEALGVTGPAELPAEALASDPEIHWLATESASSLVGSPVATASGQSARRVTITPRVPEDAVDARLESLPDAVSALLLVPHVARRAGKVASAGDVDERHLLVGIGRGGLPEPVYRALTGPLEALPTRDPEVEEKGLSHLWLTTDWSGSPLVCWDRARGWTALGAP